MATLLEQAREALSEAYAPYSEYEVGAALQTVDGTVYTGCNVENANYSNSLHAEEVALGKAISGGHREFDRLAVTSRARDGVTPCGMCRQTLAEFCSAEFEIVCESGHSDATDPNIYRLGDLLPETITRAHLEAHDIDTDSEDDHDTDNGSNHDTDNHDNSTADSMEENQ